jgi:hypothetical protein
MGRGKGQEGREGKALMKKGTERRWESRRRRRYKHCRPHTSIGTSARPGRNGLSFV